MNSPNGKSPHPGDILACTAQGVQAGADPASTLAAGFRELLRAINGKRTVTDLRTFLPGLDPVKIGIWLEDALRMGLVQVAVAAAQPAVAAAGTPFEYAGYIESDAEVAALAKDISKWVKAKPQAAIRARTSDLTKTVNMATIQSGEALHTLSTSGVLTSSDGLRLIEEAPEPMFPPIGSAPAPAPSQPAAAPAALAKAPAQVGVAKAPAQVAGVALVVEEDVPDLGKLAGLLGAAGYDIRATASRQQFVEELNNPARPDVLFIKLGSHTIDAFKTLDKIRQHPALKHLPIIITGETPTREEIAKAILLGVSGWVVKPYTAEKIAAALGGALTVVH
jgi:CheY-like chemotaxis protein